jgi:uncharacterized protein YsxB (DUF464 family)
MIRVTVNRTDYYISELNIVGHTRTDICSAVTGMCELVRVSLESFSTTAHYKVLTEHGNACFATDSPTLKGDLFLDCLSKALKQIAEENPSGVSYCELKNNPV